MPHTNRLALESSPYLQQHAHNPVDWFPWGDEALKKAKSENKPILVSIGYAACHWCHVMERESFEDDETAKIMNEFFVNIKIDREERPDLDHIYMDAVQAMTGSGGWPLNVFLTPECKPFYGGTYFPPQPVVNRPSWKDVLFGVATAYRQTPAEITEQAEKLTTHLLQANTLGQDPDAARDFAEEHLDTIFSNIMKTADRQKGGFGRAPKFPQTFSIQYLLAYHKRTGNAEALQQACVSLDKMIYGGIYDQVGGGFSRYSTDADWLVPHFEKMLYDNALLVTALSEAYQLTGREIYSRAIIKTLEFVERELLSPENGFYSALDADSEGEEGRFYVWDAAEIDSLLGDDSQPFKDFFGVSEKGNWEGKNILNIPVSPEQFVVGRGTTSSALWEALEPQIQLLLSARSRRVRPQLDDKILLGWNALMNTAYSKAYAALGDEHYKVMAENNMRFLFEKFPDKASADWFHTYKNGRSRFPAFLDDYACLIQALIHLQEITGNAEYLRKAQQITQHVIDNFGDQESELFYFTHRHQTDVVIRKKESYDGATPSGNSIMAWNLLYLAVVFDDDEWRRKVEEMLKPLVKAITRYPTSFGVWAGVLQRLIGGVFEIVVKGSDSQKLLKEILHIFIPNKILQSSILENGEFPLLKGKPTSDRPMIFLCKNYVCKNPVDNVGALIQLLED